MTGCVSKAKMPADRGHTCYGDPNGDWVGIECLSTEHCAKGLTCCAFINEMPANHCSVECDEHEACVPGAKATCHAGSRCEPTENTSSGGVCLVASPGTACGKLRCSGDKPACHYDKKRQRGECIALTPDGGWPDDRPMSQDIAPLKCASPRDCGGERCCIGGPLGMTECTGSCTSGIDVCDTVKDCPDFVGPPTGCRPDPGGAPFVKTCVYDFKTNEPSR